MSFYIGGKPCGERAYFAGGQEDKICIIESGQKDLLGKMKLQPAGEDIDNRIENHGGYNYISLKVPSYNVNNEYQNIEIYFYPHELILIHDELNAAYRLEKQLGEQPGDALTPEITLSVFFGMLTDKDAGYLAGIEDEIVVLEDSLSIDKNMDYARDISLMRKKLMYLKRYYEGLYGLLDDMQEDINRIFSREALRLIKVRANKAERLYGLVVNLRDYVTQVREAYQAQVDIDLNKTMRWFTVIATIFTPLTVITGWYGMNFMIPEFGYKYSYPIVIALSLLVVVCSVIFFKKRKWF
jgi:magnesium transporter